MHKRLLLWTLALIGLVVTGRPAAAQVTVDYRFFDSTGGALPANPTILAGTPITWTVYLVDRSGATATTLSSNGGMSGGGVNVTSSAPTVVSVNSTPPPPGAGQSTTPNSTFAQWPNGWSNAGSATNNIHLNVTGGFAQGVQPDSAGRVLLGTYTFTATNTGSTPITATITANDPNPGALSDNAFFNLGLPNNGGFDTAIAAGTQQVTIAAVPEPGSMLLCGLGAVGLAAYRRRTRKAAPAEAVA
jgi:hypothetical protein